MRHDEIWSMPADAPFYPRPPAHYRNVRLQFVFFTAPLDAIARFLPEPLEAAPDGTCVASGMEVPFCSSYGPFLEAFLLMKCVFRGQVGYYCSHVFHNGPAGIAAGREIYGTPKIFSDLTVQYIERSMFTEANLGGVAAMRISTVTEIAAAPEAMPRLTPAWRLKVIPRADGNGLDVKQLIDCTHTSRDSVTHFTARGRGTVAFAASPYLDLSPLGPAVSGEAFFLETSYSEHYAEIVHDFLKDK
jgi:acetoacetate decarboxylase